jgi:hypothetical protein
MFFSVSVRVSPRLTREAVYQPGDVAHRVALRYLVVEDR